MAKKSEKKPTKSVPKKPVKGSVAKSAKKSGKTASGSEAAKRKKDAPAKKAVVRVPPHIVKKTASSKPEETCLPIDAAKAVAFAMSIAREKKQSAALADRRRVEGEIRLSRRPTTRAQGKETVKFPEKDLRDFRKRLLDARVRAISGVDGLKATGFNESGDREADGGDGTNQTLRLQALGQMGSINRTIQQIDEALHRIDDGTYGVCTSCGQLIRKPRLLNQPFVLTCMECQSEMERGAK